MPSLLEAMEVKYGIADDQLNIANCPINILVPQKTKPSKKLLILNDCDVETAGDEALLAEKLKSVLEIDLAHNRLTEWSEISKILQYTPQVTFLNLSFNSLNQPLTLAKQESPFRFPMLPRLTVLILIGTKVSWDTINFLLKQATSLQELHLSLNNFSTIDLPSAGKNNMGGNNTSGVNRSGSSSSDSGNESCNSDDDDNGFSYPHIRKIMFDENPIDSFPCELGTCFPSLRHLGLADCPISSISEDAPEKFENLQSLSMTNTKIKDISDLVHLNSFPSLTEVRIQGIPLLEDSTSHERRQFLVAMLPKILKLNGGAPISVEEREDAERAFIRRFSSRKDGKSQDIVPPKRYYDLVAVHGELKPLVEVTLKPATRLRINFVKGENVTEKEINVYQTTNELKACVADPSFGIFKCPMKPSKIRLYYTDVEMQGILGREEMKFPAKKLYSYNMQDFDLIHVEEKP